MEWMWAAMGATEGGTGVTTKGYKKDFAGDADMDTTDQSPDNYAWYLGNASGKTHEVGKKLPNELGLSDMSGNVMEWCWDGSLYPYPDGTLSDYTGSPAAAASLIRVVRSGGWSTLAADCNIDNRRATSAHIHLDKNHGFRVVCRPCVPQSPALRLTGRKANGGVMNEKHRAVFRFLFIASVLLNIVLLSAGSWFANRDSRSQKLVGELKRNLEQLEGQLAGSLATAGELRTQVQGFADGSERTFRTIDGSLDMAEELGRIVGNLGETIGRSAQRTSQLRGEIAAARGRIEEGIEGIGRIQASGGRSAAAYHEIRSRLERGVRDIDEFLASHPEWGSVESL